MDEKIKFDNELLEPGEWTEEQKEFIDNLLMEIEKALKERFPFVSDNMKLKYYIPIEGIAAKIVVSYAVNEEINLGELDCRHHMDAFRNYPEESKKMLRSMLNNHAVSVYEQVIVRALSEQLTNLIHQSEKLVHIDDGHLIAEGKRIIQSISLPEDVVIMHPNTFEKLKQKGVANESN